MMKLIIPKGRIVALQAASKTFSISNMVSQHIPTTSIYLRQRLLQTRNTSQLAPSSRFNNSQCSKIMKRKSLFYSSVASNGTRSLMTTTRPSCSKCNRDPQKLKYVY